MVNTRKSSLSVVIPTYNRGSVLIDTLCNLLSQSEFADEIIVVDQTIYSEQEQTYLRLKELNSDGKIKWVRKNKPSIPEAMNSGLLLAKSDWVLFLDDDVRFNDDFIKSHRTVIATSGRLAHVGQIVQPWQEPNCAQGDYSSRKGLYKDLAFSFNAREPSLINNCMAGNLCVNKGAAIKAGGFDENFFGVAYRFETEFCKRFCDVHNTLFYYSPQPLLKHLHIKSGGTRAYANHLTSLSPVHSFGDYYFSLLQGQGLDRVSFVFKRFVTSVLAKFYVVKPWYIPIRLIAEIRGLKMAIKVKKTGQKLIKP